MNLGLNLKSQKEKYSLNLTWLITSRVWVMPLDDDVWWVPVLGIPLESKHFNSPMFKILRPERGFFALIIWEFYVS